jgi:acyl-CoA thioesterase
MPAFDDSARELHPEDYELMVSGEDQPGRQDPGFTFVMKMWTEDRASRSLGMELLALGPGMAEVSMRVRADMVNGHGMCHGGIIACLADTAFAMACNSGGTVTVAAGFDIEFLEPGQVGDELIATATARSHRGGSGIYDVTVRRGDAIVAEFRGRSRSRRRPA